MCGKPFPVKERRSSAPVAGMADTMHSKRIAERRTGSSPVWSTSFMEPTKKQIALRKKNFNKFLKHCQGIKRTPEWIAANHKDWLHNIAVTLCDYDGYDPDSAKDMRGLVDEAVKMAVDALKNLPAFITEEDSKKWGF